MLDCTALFSAVAPRSYHHSCFSVVRARESAYDFSWHWLLNTLTDFPIIILIQFVSDTREFCEIKSYHPRFLSVPLTIAPFLSIITKRSIGRARWVVRVSRRRPMGESVNIREYSCIEMLFFLLEIKVWLISKSSHSPRTVLWATTSHLVLEFLRLY